MVSEPPRPSVVIRPRPEALEAGDHRVQALAELADQAVGLDRLDAGRAMARVGAQRHLPALPAPRRHPHLLQRQRHQPGGDVLARCDHRVVLAGVVEQRGLAHPADQLVGLARHRRDDDRDVVAALDLALDLRAALRMRSRSATLVPPNFITSLGIRTPPPSSRRYSQAAPAPQAAGRDPRAIGSADIPRRAMGRRRSRRHAVQSG